MPSYKLGFPSESIRRHFEKELAVLDKKQILQIKTALDSLAEKPRPPGKKFRFLKPPVQIYQYTAQYRLRVGNYRIMYDLDDKTRKVILLSIRRRSEKTYR